MNKLIVSFMLLFFIGALLSGIMEGGGGINATKLNGSISATDTTITVDSTSGFLTYDYLMIEDEAISYTGTTDTTYTGCTRGWNDTDADTHADETGVYSSDASVINTALGFNVASTGATAGTFDILTISWRFITRSLPRLISWDFSFLKTDNMQYFRYMLWCISVGLIISFSLIMWSAMGGLLQAVFRR